MPRYANYGFTRKILTLQQAVATGTSQEIVVLSLPVGRCVLEKLEVIPIVAGTGTSASRVLNVRKGTASGTVAATLTMVLADMQTKGTFKAGAVTASAASFDDSDTMTVEIASGGTQFTALTIAVVLTFRELAQRAS
jgi:hypothetical protein